MAASLTSYNVNRVEQIGRYRIQRELGRGAMGVVYLALDPAIGRTVAIKTIRLQDVGDGPERTKLRDRLFREAQSAGILSHPGIVTIYDVSEQDGVAYIAMECVDGPTLDRLLAANPPSGALVLSILTQTAAALDYAHKRGIVHRDIKPANIMVHDGAVAKITDFGVAKIQSHQVTQAGSMIGTPNYMSPEQIQGKEVDGRSDQYSLAVIAYELLTGEKPFTAESIATLAFKIVNDQPLPVHRLNPSLGWTVDTVLRKGLAKEPAERYPSCSDFVFALENACRACKDWKPLPPGAAHDVATVMEERPRAVAVAPAPAVAAAPAAAVLDDEAAVKRPPALLRVVRWAAVALVAAGLVGAVFVGVAQYMESQSAPAAQELEEEPPVQVAKKPSPVPPPPQSEDSPPPAAASEPPPPAQPEAEPVPAPTRGTATVATRLVTNPPGAYVVVDGRSDQSCTSPCTLDLSPGRHTLAANREGFRRTLKIFELPRDSENFLNLEAVTGTVMVRSEPQGASIIVDGRPRPEKTPAVLTLPTGPHVLEITRNGQRERHEIAVKDSVITNIAVTFVER